MAGKQVLDFCSGASLVGSVLHQAASTSIP